MLANQVRCSVLKTTSASIAYAQGASVSIYMPILTLCTVLLTLLSYIDTPMTRSSRRGTDSSRYINIAPMRRAGTAQEVADCVLFLCSSKASFVQGSAMVVDGGYTIN